MRFLIIHTGYISFQVALYEHRQLVQTLTGDKKNACKELICTIDTLLRDNALSLNDLDFIGVNQGPGPFTSLRIGITTANGIAFASTAALIGLNSLQVMLDELADPTIVSIALLNAFNQDLYYAIGHNKKIIQEGCANHERLFNTLKMHYPDQPLCFLGNGASLYKDLLVTIFKSNAVFPEPLPQEPSLAGLAQRAYDDFINKKICKQIFPLYLKELSYQPQV